MFAQQWKVIYYADSDRVCPFRDWLDSLKDPDAVAAVAARLSRMRLGHFGKCEPVGHGVFELKIHYGPGYRIYFGIEGKCIAVLYAGGDKSTQRKDILKAVRFRKNFRRSAS